MQNSKETKIWNATLYLRLSRDDGDKEESNSIIGQRELLRNFIRTRPELREYAVRIDDGFTGSNFERPSFKKMLEDVKAGRTNCIIVKDLSRFGRNYLDAGEYIEKIFPFLGVRFIAVNDNYDSFGGKNASDELIIPFKNLINEAYCRDISVKVRTQLEVKRKSGQYIGAFAVYGYLKDEADKNHLIVDEYAADIVRDIFSWKLEGMSPQDIASPSEPQRGALAYGVQEISRHEVRHFLQGEPAGGMVGQRRAAYPEKSGLHRHTHSGQRNHTQLQGAKARHKAGKRMGNRFGRPRSYH